MYLPFAKGAGLRRDHLCVYVRVFYYVHTHTPRIQRLRIDDNRTLCTYDRADGNTIINESLIINTVFRSFVIWLSCAFVNKYFARTQISEGLLRVFFFF